MEAHYGLDQPGHCLGYEPYEWADLLEPQVTKGLAYFLMSGSHAMRIANIRALLVALTPSGKREPPPLSQLRSGQAIAEADAGAGRRIDLIAWVTARDGVRHGAVVEAKLGHHLTTNQLNVYKAAATQTPFRLDGDIRFAVVAPQFTRATAKELRENPSWSFLSWDRLIVRLEGALASGGLADAEYARFRRTVWRRAGLQGVSARC